MSGFILFHLNTWIFFSGIILFGFGLVLSSLQNPWIMLMFVGATIIICSDFVPEHSVKRKESD